MLICTGISWIAIYHCLWPGNVHANYLNDILCVFLIKLDKISFSKFKIVMVEH